MDSQDPSSQHVQASQESKSFFSWRLSKGIFCFFWILLFCFVTIHSCLFDLFFMFPRFLLSSRVELELRHANLVECPLGPDTLWGFLCLFAQGNLSSDQLIFFVLESESEQKNSVFKQKLFPVFVLFLSLFPIELQLIRWLFFNWFSLCFLSFFQVRNLEKNRFLIEPLFLVLFELNSLIKFSSDWAQILEKLSKKKLFT